MKTVPLPNLHRPSVLLLLLCAFTADFARAAPGDEHWDTRFGWPGVSEWVFGLGVNGNKLYAGGFSSTTGATNSNLSVWDGTNWSRLGTISGSLAICFDFAFIGNNVYVSGIFTRVNGVLTGTVARWDGASWSDLGVRGVVFTLATDGINLYAGGSFTNVGSVLATNVAKWDGSQWSALGPGLGQ